MSVLNRFFSKNAQSELNKGFKYQNPTSDANTFLDGVTIVSNGTNVSNLPESGQRYAILTFTLLADPVRKCQIAIGSGLMYYRFATPNWGGWYTVARA